MTARTDREDEAPSSERKPVVEPPAAAPTPPAEKNEPAAPERLLLRADLRELASSRLFQIGLVLKIVAAFLFGSHFATRWFAPFVASFVETGQNPWETFLARGEPMAFPYGPAMLLLLSPVWVPARLFHFDPSGHVGLLLLRLPLLVADFGICLLLKRWVRLGSGDVLKAYWLSPIVFYAIYVHGQLDILPTALLCLALHLVFTRRIVEAGLVFGVALATKGHLVVALPFAIVHLYRQRHLRLGWLTFAAATVGTCLALYVVPASSAAFKTMVLGSAESRKVWAVGLPFGIPGLTLYAAPAALALAFLRFFSYRKINRELTISFLGVLYVGLVALVPPQPGWYIWSLPFVAYFGSRFSRSGRYAVALLSGAYLAYFFVADPVTFLEAVDPTLGAGTGARLAEQLTSFAPGPFSAHGASVALTVLFAAAGLTAFDMYRKGVRSNALYNFREQSFMIGIGGDSGAGKHTLAADLQKLFGATLSCVNGDDDHRWERGHAMWRSYTHLDPRGNFLGAQLESLTALRHGGDVAKRHYDHDRGRFTDPVLLRPNDFIAIVGLHPFYLASQRQVLHLKVFVDPSEELRRKWKVARDVKARGYTKEKVIAEIERRMADSVKYVQPQKRHADLVLQLLEEPEGEDGIALQFELSNLLDPLHLFDALSQVPSLEVDWLPDESLERDRFVLRGTLDSEQMRLLAAAAIANVDELVLVDEWRSGSRGLAQLLVLYATSARLKRNAHTE